MSDRCEWVVDADTPFDACDWLGTHQLQGLAFGYDVRTVNSCIRHIGDLAHEFEMVFFSVVDLATTEFQKQHAADLAASLQEEQATEGDPF